MKDILICQDTWGGKLKVVYTVVASVAQFFVPMVLVIGLYLSIYLKLKNRPQVSWICTFWLGTLKNNKFSIICPKLCVDRTLFATFFLELPWRSTLLEKLHFSDFSYEFGFPAENMREKSHKSFNLKVERFCAVFFGNIIGGKIGEILKQCALRALRLKCQHFVVLPFIFALDADFHAQLLKDKCVCY